MFFSKAISLLLLASTATANPVAEPEPQTINLSYDQIVQFETYVGNICDGIQATATNGWNAFQSVNNNFPSNFYVQLSVLNYTLSRSLTPTSHLQGQFESAMRYYANSIDNSISACGQLVLMLNVASQTFDSAG